MYLDLEKLHSTDLNQKPFKYMVIEDFIFKDKQKLLCDKFPQINSSGSFPLNSLEYGSEFADMIQELYSKDFQKIVSEKFNVDLENLPIMITARGYCKNTNGQIHIDSKGKVLTFLLYFNETWDHDGGNLRLLEQENDIENYFAEIKPLSGTLITFECSSNAWHGHKPHEGKRQSIQLNWVKDSSYLQKEQFRHKISAFFKNLFK